MLAILMIIAGTIFRLIPHMPNFTPITALGLFGGRYINNKFAIFVPLIALILSDYLLLYVSLYPLQFHLTKIYPLTSLFHSTTLFVWGSFLISSLIGIWLKKHHKFGNIVGATFLASLQFFLITNFGVWMMGAYSRGFNGLAQSYVMGLPFFSWTIMGDFFYTGLFFLLHHITLNLVKYYHLKNIAIKRSSY